MTVNEFEDDIDLSDIEDELTMEHDAWIAKMLA